MNKDLAEPIDFCKLRTDLKELMEEVDSRLESEFDAYSPAMWSNLQRAVDATILRIRAVRLCLNGATSGEIAQRLNLKKQFVAALLAYNTMWQDDYASPETICQIECPSCHAPVGDRCITSSGADARVHDSRREAYRKSFNERAMNMKRIRKMQKLEATA